VTGFDTVPLKFYANDGVEISGKTKLYGILGWPVSHSLSPVFQAQFFRQFGLDAVYVPFAVPPERLQQALDGLWATGVEGANVTVPHKEAVSAMVAADADAAVIGAVNTLRRSETGWVATNTDWQGFRAVLEQVAVDLHGKSALMFGAGGTARAVVHALASMGLTRLAICNRNEERLRSLVEHAHQYYPAMNVSAVTWSEAEVARVSEQSVLLINCTSIGLDATSAFPFKLNGSGVALDVVYRPDGGTPFCEEARQAGRQVVDGLPMLIAQGAASFAWWFDGKVPDWQATLAWMESRLGRKPGGLNSWRAAV